MDFSKEELQIVHIGLDMYKAKLKKMLKDSGTLKVGEKEVKQKFLKTDVLIGRIVGKD